MTSLAAQSERSALNDLKGPALIAEALNMFGDRLALVSSFGTESAVLLHMAAELDRHMPVIFLDTGKLFAPTYDYQKRLSSHLALTNVQTIRPEAADVAEEDSLGGLWRQDPDRCCAVRKVWPLSRALAGYDAWITGRKKFQNTDRKRAEGVEVQDGRMVLSPLLQWSKTDIDAYFEQHKLPRHPLEQMGYPSVGCFTCTADVRAGDDPRSGRWRGQAKTECGIHRSALSTAA